MYEIILYNTNGSNVNQFTTKIAIIITPQCSPHRLNVYRELPSETCVAFTNRLHKTGKRFFKFQNNVI